MRSRTSGSTSTSPRSRTSGSARRSPTRSTVSNRSPRYAGYADPTCLMACRTASPTTATTARTRTTRTSPWRCWRKPAVENLEVDYPFANVASHPLRWKCSPSSSALSASTVNSRSQELTTWLDTTWAQGDYGMSEIRDSANILQYGCEGGREPLGKSSELCIPEFEDKLAVADSDHWTTTSTSPRCPTW